MAPSLSSAVPDEVLNVLLSFLTGFDLLQLSHADPVLYRGCLGDDSGVWKHCSDQEEPCPRAETWLAWLYPSNPQDPHFKAKYKRFVGGVKDSARSVTSKPASLRREHCWKKHYFTRFSLQFQGLECGPLTRRQRGGAVEVPGDLHSLMSTQSFSLDLWFALRPTHKRPIRHFGGVLLGAQSIHWIDDWWPEHHEQIAHVDPQGNLYCSMTGTKKVVARALQAETWYHLALTFDHRPEENQVAQCVYLDGELIDSSTGSLRWNWHMTNYLQLGVGCISGDSQGKPSPDHSGWYGFNGLLNESRFWKGELSHEQVQLLKNGKESAVCEQIECSWSVKQDVDAFFYGGVTCVQSTRPQERVCTNVRTRFVLPGPQEPFEPQPRPLR